MIICQLVKLRYGLLYLSKNLSELQRKEDPLPTDIIKKSDELTAKWLSVGIEPKEEKREENNK